jgi:hypothetical protein
MDAAPAAETPLGEAEPPMPAPAPAPSPKAKQPMIQPALGGAPPKLDPKVAEKRPMQLPMADKEPPTPAEAERQALAERQFEQLMELDLAEQSLGSDQKSLEALMEALKQALAEADQGEAMSEEPDGEPGEGQGKPMGTGQPTSAGPPTPNSPMKSKPAAPGEQQAADDAEPAQPLSELLQSPALQQALAMAQRLRQAALADQPPQQAAARTTIGPALGNLRPTSTAGQIVKVDLADLDPAMRAVLLKMQPQLREELLQGMREQGPEGYRKFIQDYFQRLSTAKGPK